MEIEQYILILTPLIMLLGTLLINRENRLANARLQREIERLRKENDAAAAKQNLIDQNNLRRGYLFGFKVAMADLLKQQNTD